MALLIDFLTIISDADMEATVIFSLRIHTCLCASFSNVGWFNLVLYKSTLIDMLLEKFKPLPSPVAGIPWALNLYVF